MEHYWEIERLRALQEDTPHIWEQQSSFLRPVVQPNDYHWMPEPNNTIFSQQKSMWRCDICNGNHPSDYCEYNYNLGWKNYQNPSWYDEPSHFTKPHLPSYPPSIYDSHQEPEPSEEDQILHMFKDWFKERAAQIDAQVQSQTESIQRMTDQIRQLTENQNFIPREAFSDDQAFHEDTSTEKEVEQNQELEVSVQKHEPAKYRFDFYYSDSDEDEAELFVPTAPTTEDQTFNPQNEDLGACFNMMFDEDLPEPIISPRSEDEDLKSDISLHPQVDNFEACISQMTDEELNEEILKYICEEKVEQKAEQMEEQMSDLTKDPEHSGTAGATKFKKVAQALNETKFFLLPYCWKRPFKSNAHGIVCNRTSKTTLKPP